MVEHVRGKHFEVLLCGADGPPSYRHASATDMPQQVPAKHTLVIPSTDNPIVVAVGQGRGANSTMQVLSSQLWECTWYKSEWVRAV